MNNFPAKMIQGFAKTAPEEVRAMFIALFDESKDVVPRIIDFKDQSSILLEKYGNGAGQHYQYENVSDNLWLIREQYLSLLTDFEVLSEEDITAKRDELQKLTFEVYNKSPKTDAKSYAEAQKALKTEEEQFFTPEEIDKMLPAHLRIVK